MVMERRFILRERRPIRRWRIGAVAFWSWSVSFGTTAGHHGTGVCACSCVKGVRMERERKAKARVRGEIEVHLPLLNMELTLFMPFK